MKVLVACEESQAVCKAFRARGHEAYSCDIIECSGGHPEWHIRQDVIPLLNGRCRFRTDDGAEHEVSGRWDMIIAFPPCTNLCASGARWFREKQKDFRQQRSIVFFMTIALADCEKVAVENPVGIMGSIWRKADQIIQPYQFGDSARKTTCLWLRGLKKLVPTNIVSAGEINRFGQSIGASAYCAVKDGKMLAWNNPETARIRSKTFPSIARAMAEQWG